MGKETVYMGGLRGGRRPQGTYYPSLRPGHGQIDAVRQATRHFNAAERPMSGSTGSVNRSRTDPTVLPPATLNQITLALADASTTNYILGLIATVACVKISYWLRRNFGTAVMAGGELFVWHDGTNAFISEVQNLDSAAAEHNVTFTADIDTGNLRLVITVSDETPDATADLILLATPVNLP
jgi:hypothetical protein